ncbi:hypothetical protein C9374_009774 [Naegleria lovaniensis]|uniref:Peptidase S53 domain-containing protein n=1 Tax=Naegleria lovaniensis TaxID=51637 RepID=A0AA88H5E7_NAELO|nr:uncharacterized protein C9374_009774 [Naegleria lovaniensis]KAG2393197.1 hypothetical protein C9374_009774 [Naegleria lovaniensis]
MHCSSGSLFVMLPVLWLLHLAINNFALIHAIPLKPGTEPTPLYKCSQVEFSMVHDQNDHFTILPPEWKSALDLFSLHPHVKPFIDTSKRVSIIFALKPNHEEWLRKAFHQVSDPSSPQFRHYYSMKEIEQYTKPRNAHVQLVLKYIREVLPSEDIILQRISHHENFIQVQLPIRVVNECFQANMMPFIHETTKRVVYRSVNGYSIPQVLREVLDEIIGIHQFPILPQQAALKKLDASSSSPYITNPPSIWKRYNITLPMVTSPKNKQSVASFLEQYVLPQDLQQFQQLFKLPQMTPTIIGPNDPKEPGFEATLDIQYIMAVGYLVNTSINSIKYSDDDDEPFIDWVHQIQSEGDQAAWVHSISYGQVEKYVSKSYQRIIDTEFMKIGLSGRSILVASGDFGARCSSDGSKFQAEWPTSSPFATSIGATEPDEAAKEVSVKWSGGGFSESYSMPEYQQDVVNAYLRQPSVPPRSYFNDKGRAYPDISAVGVNYQIILSGQLKNVSGTSCSTPCTAGIISLLNDLRFKLGKAPLGFLNPWLYKDVITVPGALFDITHGNNAVSPCPGFSAVQGFDPISGLGVLNFDVLRRVAITSP